jgi:hypothetical protein
MAAPVVKVATAAGANNAQATAVIDSAILSLLSQPDLARLVAVLEPSQAGLNATKAAEFLQAAITAAAEGDVTRALQEVAEMVRTDPYRAETVRAEPGLSPLRPQVESVLARLANVAKLDAESRVGEATRAVESRGGKPLPEWEARPETLLMVANRLLDAGGHVNSVRATQVAQAVIDAAHWAPAAGAAAPDVPVLRRADGDEERRSSQAMLAPSVMRSWTALRKRAPAAQLAIFWRRAPLLVLLLGWLAIGAAGGVVSWIQRRLWPDVWPAWLSDSGFTLWGLGFLALVLFGFYTRVRNVRL